MALAMALALALAMAKALKIYHLAVEIRHAIIEWKKEDRERGNKK
jgi:hypothetical protein